MKRVVLVVAQSRSGWLRSEQANTQATWGKPKPTRGGCVAAPAQPAWAQCGDRPSAAPPNASNNGLERFAWRGNPGLKATPAGNPALDLPGPLASDKGGRPGFPDSHRRGWAEAPPLQPTGGLLLRPGQHKPRPIAVGLRQAADIHKSLTRRHSRPAKRTKRKTLRACPDATADDRGRAWRHTKPSTAAAAPWPSRLFPHPYHKLTPTQAGPA